MAESSPSAPTAQLDAFQRECIHIFIHAAQAVSIPRSIGEIYGLLYGSREPMAMDEIIARLEMSKGSASQGLRWLREVSAVKTVYVAGDRRDHFVAETELRKLATGYLRESIEPRLSRSGDYLERLESASGELESREARDFAERRTAKLRRWKTFVGNLLPLLLRIAGKF